MWWFHFLPQRSTRLVDTASISLQDGSIPFAFVIRDFFVFYVNYYSNYPVHDVTIFQTGFSSSLSMTCQSNYIISHMAMIVLFFLQFIDLCIRFSVCRLLLLRVFFSVCLLAYKSRLPQEAQPTMWFPVLM